MAFWSRLFKKTTPEVPEPRKAAPRPKRRTEETPPVFLLGDCAEAFTSVTENLVNAIYGINPNATFVASAHWPLAEISDNADFNTYSVPITSKATAAQEISLWKPDAIILFGSGNDTHLLAEGLRQNIPVVLVCDQIPASFPRATMRRLTAIFVSDPGDADLLRRRGATGVDLVVTGSLEADGHVPDCDQVEYQSLAERLAGRPSWLAARVSKAEMQMMIDAHSLAARFAHRLLLVLLPTRPEFSQDLAEKLRADRWRVSMASRNDALNDETQIYFADTGTDNGLWYRLCSLTFLGGTLQPDETRKGADPFAPASLGSAILFGPQPSENPRLLDRLAREGAAQKVITPRELGEALNTLVAPDKSALMAHNAWRVVSEDAAAAQRIARRLLDIERRKG